MKRGARELSQVADQATLIRCRYCDIRDNCSKKATKEKAENKGILTYCAITPNKNKKRKR